MSIDSIVHAALNGATSADIYPEEDAPTRPLAAVPTTEDTPLYQRYGITGDHLEGMHFPALQWAVPGLIPEGYGLLVAAPKVGKSFMVAGIGLAAARGGRALGSIPVSPRPVLYLALEDSPRRLRSRYKHLIDGAPIPSGITSITDVPPTVAWTIMHEYAEAHADESPLIIVDTYQKVAPPKTPGESAYAHDYRAGSMFKNVAKKMPSGTILVAHHTNKAQHDDFQDSVSGTQGVAGAADFALILQRPRQSCEAILSVTGRDVVEDEYALVTDEGVWTLAGGSLEGARGQVAEVRERSQREETAGRKGTTLQQIAEWVGRQTVLVTVEDVAATFPEIKRDTVRKNLNRASSDGLIQSPSRGLYAALSFVSGVS